MIGAVGQLQFEVFKYRIENEYNAPLRMDSLDYSVAQWIKDTDMETVKHCLDSRTMLVFDRFDRPLLLFPNQFTLNFYRERFPDVKLVDATEI